MSPTTRDEFLTIAEVQDLLKVSRTFAYGLVESGRVPGYRLGDKLVRVRRAELERWLEDNRCATTK